MSSEPTRLSMQEAMQLKIAKILSEKETVDEDVKWLENEVNSLSNYLKTYAKVKGQVLGAIHARRLRTRKLVTMSLAISASSLIMCLHRSGPGMKETTCWVTALGAASLAFSLVYLRDFLLSFKDPCAKWKAIEAEVSDVPRRHDPDEESNKPVDESPLDKSFSEYLETSLDRDERASPQGLAL